MSEPIGLYNIKGELVRMVSPMVAKELVINGELFDCPPVVEESPPPKKRVTRRKAASK